MVSSNLASIISRSLECQLSDLLEILQSTCLSSWNAGLLEIMISGFQERWPARKQD